MHVIDLTQTIAPDMPVYPGADQPVIERGCTISPHGFEERRVTMLTHTGTHVDAPAHLLAGGKSLDQFDAGKFTGPACVVDLRQMLGASISLKTVHAYAPRLEAAEFVLLHTGWDRFWGQKKYFRSFPTLTARAAQWLAGLGLKGIGMDCISPDPVQSRALPIHRIFLEQEMVIVENLANLAAIPPQATFSALPLKIREADGSPVRAVAICP